MRTRHKVLSKNPNLVKARFVKLIARDSTGAGDGTRTRDNLLGRQELYHLSYSRMTEAILVKYQYLVKKCISQSKVTPLALP